MRSVVVLSRSLLLLLLALALAFKLVCSSSTHVALEVLRPLDVGNVVVVVVASGTIPSGLGIGFTSLDFRDNLFTAFDNGLMEYGCRKLNLSHNNFSGTVPEVLSRIQWLDLSYNCFTYVSADVLWMPTTNAIDISHNCLQGTIPSSSQCNPLSIDVSYNNYRLVCRWRVQVARL